MRLPIADIFPAPGTSEKNAPIGYSEPLAPSINPFSPVWPALSFAKNIPIDPVADWLCAYIANPSPGMDLETVTAVGKVVSADVSSPYCKTAF